MEKHIDKIKKIVDDIYFILICAGFLSLMCHLPYEIADFFGIEFFRNNNALFFILIPAFLIFRFYINDLYETKQINEKYYGKSTKD